MKIYRIRQIGTQKYIGKNHVSYAFLSDKDIDFIGKTSKEVLKNLCGHWFVPIKKAKLWDDPKNIQWLYSYTGKYTDSKDNYKEKISTFSNYEVEIDDNGVITHIQLDEFIKSLPKYKVRK